MDTVLLFALPLVGGLWFCSTWNFTRYRIAREDGHRLYFRAVFWGSLLFIIASLARLFARARWAAYRDLEGMVQGAIVPLAKDPASASGVAEIAMSCFVAMLMGGPLALLLNRLPFTQRHCLRKAIRGDDFELLLYRAWTEKMPVCVSMADGKAYVGFVTQTFDPTKSRKTVTLLPIMSGFRRDADRRIEFTTFYLQLYGGALTKGGHLAPPLDHLTPNDFLTVVPVDSIVSARLFDISAYAAFQLAGARSGGPQKKA